MLSGGRKDLDSMVVQCEEIISRLKAHLHPPAATSRPEQSLAAHSFDKAYSTDVQTTSLLSEFYSHIHDVLLNIPEQSHSSPLSTYVAELGMANIAAYQRDLRIFTSLPRQFFSLVPLVRYAHHVAKATQHEHLSVCLAAPLLTLGLSIAYARILTEAVLLSFYINGFNARNANRSMDALIATRLSVEVNDTLGSLAIIASLVAPTLLPECGARDSAPVPASNSIATHVAPQYPLPLWVPVALAQLFELSMLMQWAVAASTRAQRTLSSDWEQINAARDSKPTPAPVSHDKDEFVPALFFLEKARDVWQYLPASFTPTAADAMEARLSAASANASASVSAGLPEPLSPVPLPFTPFQPHHLPETALHALAAAAEARDRTRAPTEAKAKAESDAEENNGTLLSRSTDMWTSCPPAGLYLYSLLALLCVPATMSLLRTDGDPAPGPTITSTSTSTTCSSVRVASLSLATSGAALRCRWAVRMAYIVQAKMYTPLVFYLGSQASCCLWDYTLLGQAATTLPTRESIATFTKRYRVYKEQAEATARQLKTQKDKTTPEGKKKAEEYQKEIDTCNEQCTSYEDLVALVTDAMLLTLTPPTSALLSFLTCSFAHLFARVAAVNVSEPAHKDIAAFLPRWPVRPLHALRTFRSPLSTRAGASPDSNATPPSLQSPFSAALPEYSEDPHEAYLGRRQFVMEKTLFALYVLQLRADVLWSLSEDTTMLLALAWACARRAAIAISPVFEPWFDTTYIMCREKNFTPWMLINDIFSEDAVPLCFPSHVVPDTHTHRPPAALQTSVFQRISSIFDDALVPLQSVANPVHRLPFVPVPSLLTQEQANLIVKRGPRTTEAHAMSLVLAVLAEPELLVWLTGEPPTGKPLPLPSRLLAHVGYAHLSRGAWACVEQRMHAQLTQPLQPAEDALVRDAMGLTAPRTRTHAQLPLYAVPPVLTEVLKAHADHCYGYPRDVVEGDRPRTLMTVPLLAFVPTAALLPPLLALLCSTSLLATHFSRQAIPAESAHELLLHLATAAALEEDLGAVEYKKNTESGIGSFVSPVLGASGEKSSVLRYEDPILTALDPMFASKAKDALPATRCLEILLSQVGILALASTTAPRLSVAEMECLKQLEVVAPVLKLVEESTPLVHTNSALPKQMPTSTIPFEHRYAVCLAAGDARESAPSLVDAVIAHNTPLQPTAAVDIPACSRCGNVQVPALTFMCIARDAGSDSSGAEQDKASVKSDNDEISVDDILCYAHPATTCLACFPSSLPQAELVRRALLAGWGAVVSIAGAEAQAIQEEIISKAQKQAQTGATKSGKGPKLPANLLKAKTNSPDVPSVPPERNALATSPGLRLCLRFCDMAHVKPQNPVMIPVPSGQYFKEWAVRWLFDSVRRHGDKRVRATSTNFAYHATMRLWVGGSDSTAASTLVPLAALSPHFPALDLGSLAPTRMRAAAMYVALRLVPFLKMLIPDVDALLMCRDSMATMLLSHTANATTATTTAGATAAHVMGNAPFSFSHLSLQALAGCVPERMLVMESDYNTLMGLFSSPFLASMFAECTCTLSDSRKSRESGKSGKITLPKPLTSPVSPASVSCPKHGPWFSAMPSLLRALTTTDVRLHLSAATTPATMSLDQLTLLNYMRALLAAPHLPAAISLSLLAHALRVCTAIVPALLASLAAPARASALVLRTVAALNALNAALPTTVFAPGSRPQLLRVDMLAAATPVPLWKMLDELECLRVPLSVVSQIVLMHAQAAEVEREAATDTDAVMDAPNAKANGTLELEIDTDAESSASARHAATTAATAPVPGMFLPQPLLHCAATLAHSLPLVVIAAFLGSLPDTASAVSEALENCAAALVPLDGDAATGTVATALRHALRRAVPSDVGPVAQALYQAYVRSDPDLAVMREEAIAILTSQQGDATLICNLLQIYVNMCVHPAVFCAAMHAEEQLRLVLTPHVHVPAHMLAAQYVPQLSSAAQVQVVNELCGAVTCHVTPSMAVDIVPTATHAVPVTTLCAWLDHLRLACCVTHAAAAAVAARPAATLVATAEPETNAHAETTKTDVEPEPEPEAKGASSAATADPWEGVWTWLLDVRRTHVHTLAREYATHGTAQVLLRRLPSPARVSMSCYDTLPYTPQADASELCAADVPTLSQVPVHAQTWVLLCTRLWNDAAQKWARSVALGALCQLEPGLCGRTSEVISAAAARHPACFDAFMRSDGYKTFAALAVAAGMHGVRVPGLLVQAARASAKWQGAHDPLLFPCPSAAPHVRTVSADVVFAPTHATLRDRTVDVSRYTVSVSLPCVPEYIPVPVPEWQQAKPTKLKASEDTEPTAKVNPFEHRLLANFYYDYNQPPRAPRRTACIPEDFSALCAQLTTVYSTLLAAAGADGRSSSDVLDSDDDPAPSHSTPACVSGHAAASRGGTGARGQVRGPYSSATVPRSVMIYPEQIISDDLYIQSTSNMDSVE